MFDTCEDYANIYDNNEFINKKTFNIVIEKVKAEFIKEAYIV